jgi:serine protease Do
MTWFWRAWRRVALWSGLAAAFLPGLGGFRGWPVGEVSVAREAHAQAAESAPPVAALPSFADVAKAATPAVVNIAVTEKPDKQRRTMVDPKRGPHAFGGDDPLAELFPHLFGVPPTRRAQRSLGSGFVISPDGYIVTNNHVIGNAGKITVSFSDTETYAARVVGRDDKTDVALLKIQPRRALPTVALGRSADVQVGDWVVAIGNAFGLTRTVTAGIVSAKGRVIGSGPYDDFIQTDASINPGNSGGPLLNARGEVVGMNSAILSHSGGNVGIGFATPVDLVKTVVRELQEHGAVTRAWLGVTIQPVTRDLAAAFGLGEPTGALVAEVARGGPASRAGILRGDIITSFNGVVIKESHELPTLVARAPVGAKAVVSIVRKGAARSVPVTLGKMPK